MTRGQQITTMLLPNPVYSNGLCLLDLPGTSMIEMAPTAALGTCASKVRNLMIIVNRFLWGSGVVNEGLGLLRAMKGVPWDRSGPMAPVAICCRPLSRLDIAACTETNRYPYMRDSRVVQADFRTRGIGA